MSKSELIDTIRELNSTASVEFLSQFDEKDLKEYMSHLLETDRAELTAAAPSVPFN
jgi:Mg/Co/Ni transporter MgtE